jgi:hypothetical protein
MNDIKKLTKVELIQLLNAKVVENTELRERIFVLEGEVRMSKAQEVVATVVKSTAISVTRRSAAEVQAREAVMLRAKQLAMQSGRCVVVTEG